MKQYIVDAFTSEIFHGNQAAVCIVDTWPDAGLMQDIARENNFSETAFAAREEGGYGLRWFTPGGEIDFCGHATLATASVLFGHYEQGAERITFHTLSGDFHASRRGSQVVMDFPAYRCHEVPLTTLMEEATGARPSAAYLDRDLLLVYDDERTVREMQPDFRKLAQLDGLGVAVTAPASRDGGPAGAAQGSHFDCISRFFAPKLQVDEDPVTGSAHCMIAPYWANRLGRSDIHAYQASSRGGKMLCEVRGDRVIISGEAVLFSVAELKL